MFGLCFLVSFWLVASAVVAVEHWEEDPIDCPKGYTKMVDHCYKYVNEALTYFEAVTACDVIDGKVIEITSPEQQQLVNQFLGTVNLDPRNNLWLGANDILVEGEWQYDSSHNKDALSTWSNWAPSHPRVDTDSNCASMNAANQWAWIESPCTYHQPFVCMIKLREDDSEIIG